MKYHILTAEKDENMIYLSRYICTRSCELHVKPEKYSALKRIRTHDLYRCILIYEISWILTLEKDRKTWLMIAAMHTT